MKTILVIGGGASGLACAIAAAQHAPETRVLVLERLDRVGKKLLATGNGRCNLSNETIAPSFYHTQSPAALSRILTGMSSGQILDFFEELGLYCEPAEEGRLYPYCRQASMVLDILLLALRRLGIETVCGCGVVSAARQGGGFTVVCGDGRRFSGDALVLASGGKAAPKLGSDGSGFLLAKGLGHTCTPLYPALTALRCRGEGLASLKGVRAQGTLALYAGERLLRAETGEIQFAEYGLSGIPAMQVSGSLRQAGDALCTARVDLFPGWTQGQLLMELRRRRAAHPDETLEELLLGLLHKKLAAAAAKAVGLSPMSRSAASLSGKELQSLCRGLKDWRFSVTGTQGWENAQVTGGGVPLDQVWPDTMESRLRPGLYLTGEVLDAAGDCGGYNLHWAWGTGIRAGRAAAERMAGHPAGGMVEARGVEPMDKNSAAAVKK